MTTTFHRWAAGWLGGMLTVLSPWAAAVVGVPESGLVSGAIAAQEEALLADDLRFDGGLASVGSLVTSNFEGRAQTAFGVNHAYAAADGGSVPEGPRVASVSAWFDKVVVTASDGASGAFSLPVSVTLSADIEGSGFAELRYGLFALAQQDVDKIQQLALNAGELLASLTNGGSPAAFGLPDGTVYYNEFGTEDFPEGGPAKTLNGTLQGQYGEAFYVVSVLNPFVIGNGFVDASHTATFRIDAPAGIVVASSSGTAYVQAVPEPRTVALCLAGLIVVGLASIRARHRG